MLRGLMVSILRDASHGDCTNGGVTSPVRAPNGDAILLGCEEGNWQEGALPDGMPVLIMKKGSYRGEEYVYAVPFDIQGKHLMAGGNFVYSCDSRFARGVCPYPIPVHDRME